MREREGLRWRREDRDCDSRKVDVLTGLPGLNLFMDEATLLLKRAADSGQVAFVFFDVDNFKTFNRKYGFSSGSDFLQGVARAISEEFPERLVSRLYDDHFAVLDYSATVEERVKNVLEKTRKLRRNINMELKAGIYVPDSAVYSIALVMDRAKMACDSIKRVFDQNYRFYDWRLEETIKVKNHVISDFRSALDNNYIKVFYQPEVRTMTGEVCGYEALARWIDPVYGMLSPAVFVEVLENVHLVHLLDLYVIEEVCRRLQEGQQQGRQLVSVSVNLSRIDFLLADMFAEIEKLRNKYELPTELLNIEITESALYNDGDNLREQIERFREAGYEVWMDDFGSGYATLNNLKDYRFDVLKIDMHIIRGLENNENSKKILSMIVNLAKELKMHTLAEGVETAEQLEFLRAIGCEKIQGYLFGKPMPFGEQKHKLRHEPMELRAYYDKIGITNVLSTFPLRDVSAVYRFVNHIAVAVIECNTAGEELTGYHYLYKNRIFVAYMKDLGFEATDEDLTYFAAHFAHNGLPAMPAFFRRCLETKNERTETNIEGVIRGAVCSFAGRCSATSGARAAFVVIVK